MESRLDGRALAAVGVGRLAGRPQAAARRGAVTGELLANLLRAHAGNVSAVARVLATSRTQVTRLMHRFGLDPWGNSARS